MTQGQKRRGRHTDVDLATVIDSKSTCQTTEMFEMGQKKASGCLPCRAIQRTIDFSALDFVYLAFFLSLHGRTRRKSETYRRLGSCHTLKCILLMRWRSCICIQRSRTGQSRATLLDAERHVLPILIWIGKCLDSELMLVVLGLNKAIRSGSCINMSPLLNVEVGHGT
jgi:hypothetical protein